MLSTTRGVVTLTGSDHNAAASRRGETCNTVSLIDLTVNIFAKFTLHRYADVHYYFAKPITRPIHHRFDKASYFYVYYNSTRQTSRVEIANNPGTDFQDAFNGSLDRCKIKNSYTFPTLFTIEVDADDVGNSPASSTSRDKDEWCLETGDSNDTRREKQTLHTLDVYFWTQEDAKLAVEFCKKLLGRSQLDIVESPQANASARQQETFSPVVQNLENVAVSDPAYGNGQTRNSQNQPQSQSIKLPPPPPPPPQAGRDQSGLSAHDATTTDKSRGGRRNTSASQKSEPEFTPFAYNPAAPAAPEPRAHREKTPPPEDDTHGTGLKAVAHDDAYEHGYHSSQSYTSQSAVSQPRYGHYGSPPPPSSVSGYGTQPSHGLAASSPPPPPPPLSSSQQRTAHQSSSSVAPSFAPPPVSTTPGYGAHSSSAGYSTPSPQQHQGRSSQASTAMSFGPPPSSTVASYDIHRHSSAAEHYTPDHFSSQQQSPAETPGTEFYRTLEQPAKPLQHVRPQYPDVLADRTSPAPPGSAYYQHTHGQHAPPDRYDNDPYAIHNQVYRPTEHEKHSHSKPPKSGNSQGTVSRIDSTADKLKGKFMKRFG